MQRHRHPFLLFDRKQKIAKKGHGYWNPCQSVFIKKGVNYYIHLKTSVFHPCYSVIKTQ
ncbi:hypothetical protein WYY_03537 [Bacillus velezensis M27]|uniref:Uncharacterized protein n=1 Tax=Bacillus amyloliquefaciens (strain Y2) TaxID=1155777 RepID=I2CAK0_BACAY|nr:hypothetical protein MUS_3816 [Bacillus velezensis YAU B9601-Y2]AFZ92292.1 hypothetical protein B938_16440 [Bacillus velezensis AS43.3]AGF26117.1 hypothetical protein KSO_003100 [Bacillus amyloliquefaciens IT-45]AGZ58023.1 hypothetical protein U471_33250 [Bacillus amyloliquefaciens CC178]AHC44451.1 hypothetical protein U722_17170 [Bacillus amyloliquefaciens LFB112]ANF38246.1 hypothetical protein BCBMB205_33600 [Bacillus velezensis]EIF14808.1 hypothetical protein MY7_3172 [Bacillus sp. 5B6]